MFLQVESKMSKQSLDFDATPAPFFDRRLLTWAV
jgi:hypothetical protein